MGCTSPPAASVIAELATLGISRHCRRRPPSVVAGPAVLSPAPTMSPTIRRGASSPSSLGIPPIPPPPTPNLAWPGQRRTVREHDTRGNGGGFAPLEAFCRRVAGVSRLYWCNSPRLVAPSTWGELDRGPLMARIPRLPVVRPRFGAARRPHRRPTRRQTSTTGVVGEVACVVDTTASGPAWSSHANPLLRALTSYLARKPAIPCLGGAAHARISGPTCDIEGPGAH